MVVCKYPANIDKQTETARVAKLKRLKLLCSLSIAKSTNGKYTIECGLMTTSSPQVIIKGEKPKTRAPKKDATELNFKFLRYKKVKKEAKIVGVILSICQKLICDTN